MEDNSREVIERVIFEVSPKYVRKKLLYNFLLIIGLSIIELPLIILVMYHIEEPQEDLLSYMVDKLILMLGFLSAFYLFYIYTRRHIISMRVSINPHQKDQCAFRIECISHLFHQDVYNIRNVKPNNIKFLSDVMSISIKGEKFMFPDLLVLGSFTFYSKTQKSLRELCGAFTED